jgi:hypothetical protein
MHVLPSVRVAVLLLLALVSWSGCAPKNPLDRIVKAETPAELSNWWDNIRDKLGDAERDELYGLIRYLQDATPRLRSMTSNDRNDPLCTQINRLKVRSLMIFAYEEKNRHIRQRVMAETGRFDRLLAAVSEATNDADRERSEGILNHARQRIESADQAIAINNHRIAELAPPATAP